MTFHSVYQSHLSIALFLTAYLFGTPNFIHLLLGIGFLHRICWEAHQPLAHLLGSAPSVILLRFRYLFTNIPFVGVRLSLIQFCLDLDHFLEPYNCELMTRVHRLHAPCPFLCVPSFLLTSWLRTVYITELHIHVFCRVYSVPPIFTSCTFMSLDGVTPYCLLSRVRQLSQLHTLSGQAQRIYDHFPTSFFIL